MAIPILNDPFSRWGWGGYGVKINNFFPQQYGGDCGCGGRMQAWMFGMMAMNQVLGGIFNMFKPNDGQGAAPQMPAQMGMPMYGGMPMASSFYPYVNFQHAPYGDGLGGNSSNNPAMQQAKIKNLLQLPENKKLYSGIVTNPDGSGYLIKDKKSVPFSNLDELESMLQENVGKEVQETEEEEDPDNKTKVSPDNKEGTDPDNKVETEPDSTVKAEDNGNTSKADNTKKYKKGKAPDGYKWSKYSNLDERSKALFTENMGIDDILNKIPCEVNDANRKLLRDANPNAIVDDVLVNPEKLDLFIKSSNNNSSSGNNNNTYTINGTGKPQNGGYQITANYTDSQGKQQSVTVNGKDKDAAISMLNIRLGSISDIPDGAKINIKFN